MIASTPRARVPTISCGPSYATWGARRAWRSDAERRRPRARAAAVMHWAIAVPLCPNSSPAELLARWRLRVPSSMQQTVPTAAAVRRRGRAMSSSRSPNGEAGANFNRGEAVGGRRCGPSRWRMFSSSRILSRSPCRRPASCCGRRERRVNQNSCTRRSSNCRGGAIIAKTLALEPSDCFLLCGKNEQRAVKF